MPEYTDNFQGFIQWGGGDKRKNRRMERGEKRGGGERRRKEEEQDNIMLQVLCPSSTPNKNFSIKNPDFAGNMPVTVHYINI